MNTKPLISVVIPSYNKIEVLPVTLDVLKTQTISTSDFEVLIVDDGSTDQTINWLQNQSWPFSCHVISQHNQGAGAARNHGAQQSKGQVLLFLDADIIASPDLLQQHWQAHQKSERTLVMGRIQLWQDSVASRIYQIFASIYDMGNGEKILKYPFGLTQNLSIHIEDFLSLQGFDEKLHWGEDTEFSYRAVKAGFELHYYPQALAYHNHALNLDQICQKIQCDHRQLGFLFREHPEIIDDLEYLQDKLPIHWFEDPPQLVARKLAREAFTLPPLRTVLYKACLFLERTSPTSPSLEFLVWKLLGAYQWIGLREGMQEYGWRLP